MRRRTLFVAGGLIVAIVIAVAVVLVISKRPSDCDTVRSMIAHNNEFNEHVASATAIGVQTDRGEFRDWASQLGHLAGQIRDPALADKAGELADLAEESLAAGEQFRADARSGTIQTSPTPQYAKDYSRIGKEFDANLAALDQSCPA